MWHSLVLSLSLKLLTLIGPSASGFDGALNVDITELLEGIYEKHFWFPSLLLFAPNPQGVMKRDLLNSIPANQIAAPSDAKSKVPDQFGPLPTHSLHVDLLCSSHLCGEGLPWAAFCGRDYYVCLRTGIHDGQVRSSPRQVHGVLHDVSRSLFWSSFSKCFDMFWLICPAASTRIHPSGISYFREFLVKSFFGLNPFNDSIRKGMKMTLQRQTAICSCPSGQLFLFA